MCACISIINRLNWFKFRERFKETLLANAYSAERLPRVTYTYV